MPFCIAHLNASPDDIAFLRAALGGTDLYVAPSSHGEALVIRGDRCDLTTSDAWHEAEVVRRAILGSLNAYANMLRMVEVVAPVSAVDDSGRGESVAATLTFNVRIKSEEGRQRLLAVISDGADTVLGRIVRIAREHADVARVLSLLHEHDPSWSDIYLILEIIDVNLRSNADNMGGRDWAAIIRKGWLPGSLIRAIKRHAGYHRHAQHLYAEPKPKLSLSEARAHCKNVTRHWLEDLIKE